MQEGVHFANNEQLYQLPADASCLMQGQIPLQKLAVSGSWRVALLTEFRTYAGGCECCIDCLLQAATVASCIQHCL